MHRGWTVLSLILGGLSLVALTIVFIRPISDPDYWWHLRAGKQILETRQLHDTDPWSLTAELDDGTAGPDERIWNVPPLSRREYRKLILTGEWLSEVALAGAYDAAGHRGTTALAALSALTALALAFLFVFRLGVPAALCVLAAGLAIWEFGVWGVPRPQVLTYVAGAGFVWLFDLLRRGKRWALVALPLIAVLWSNAHAGYLVGILIGLAFLAGAVGDRLLGRPGRPGLAAAGLLASIAGFAVNPNGLNAVAASFVVKIALFSRMIAEWQPTGSDRWVFFALLAFSALAMITAVSLRRAPLAHAALVVGFGVMGISSYRHVPLFSLLGFPVAVLASYRAMLALSFTRPVSRWLEKSAPVPGIAALSLAAVSITALALDTRPHAFGVDEELVPRELTDHLNELPVDGPVFNQYGFGGYLLWALDPPRRLFIDGRSLSERASWEWRQAIVAQPPIYPYLFDRYDIPILAVSVTNRAGLVNRLVLEVTEDPDWVTSFVGRNSAVFVRRTALPAPTTDRAPDLYVAAARRVQSGPAHPIDKAVDLALLYGRLGMLDQALAYADSAFPPGHGDAPKGSALAAMVKALGDAADRAGRPDEALAQYHRAPGDPRVAASLALLLLRQAESEPSRLSAAVAALRAAVVAETCQPAVHEALDLHDEFRGNGPIPDLLSRGLYLRALRATESLLAGNAEDARAEFFRGVALLKLCRYEDAQEAFRRSAQVDGGLQSAPATTVMNLGWALFDGGHPDKALGVFESVLARRQSPAQALFGAGLASKFVGRRDEAMDYFARYLQVAVETDPWAGRAQANLEELRSYPHFRGL